MRDDELFGWSTDLLVALDGLATGLIRRLLVSAPMVRQAIFLTLAQWDTRLAAGADAPPQEEAVVTADLLRSGRAKEIVTHHFGSVPDGLLPALERIGPLPLATAESYRRLWAVFADGDGRKVRALREIGEITARTLRVLDILDPVLVHAEVLKRVETAAQAHDLNRSIRFLRGVCSIATDEAVATAVANMRSPDALPRLLQRFLRRADRFPPQPVEGDHELRPLATARAMIAAGRDYRNCLASMVGEALVGRVAFAEFTGATANMICEFRPLSSGRGWLLVDVHAPRNGLAPRELRQAAEEKCASLGIPHIAAPDAGDWRSVRRLIRRAQPFALPA